MKLLSMMLLLLPAVAGNAWAHGGGLNKDGDRFHPDQPVTEYTLVTLAYFVDERSINRWQRDPQTLKFPVEPETYRF